MPGHEIGLSSAAVGVHVKRLAELARQVIDDYASGRTHGQYWADGSFVASDGAVKCWYCYDTPATTAGILSNTMLGSAHLRKIAIDTWTQAIKTHLLASGAISDAGASVPVDTGMFAVQIGLSYLEMKSAMTPRIRTVWADALVKMANYLINGGGMTFYINGNVMLRQTEVMWLTWAVTHQSRYYRAYQQEYAFALRPTLPRWRGYGLEITTPPSAPYGENGSGYLTESDGGRPGFDASYTAAQLDTATQLYVLTRDSRYLWLMNIEFNQLRPYVNGSYILDARGGTRKNDTVAFLTAAPFVLMLSGTRPDLASYWLGQLRQIHAQFTQSEGFASIGPYDAVSSSLGIPLLAIQYPRGLLKPACRPIAAPCDEVFSAGEGRSRS